jgi:hypothetical protein
VSCTFRLTGVPELARADNWSKKAMGRKTTGTGRMRTMKDLPRKFKNGFREGAPQRCFGKDGSTVRLSPFHRTIQTSYFAVRVSVDARACAGPAAEGVGFVFDDSKASPRVQ